MLALYEVVLLHGDRQDLSHVKAVCVLHDAKVLHDHFTHGVLVVKRLYRLLWPGDINDVLLVLSRELREKLPLLLELLQFLKVYLTQH